MVSLIRIWFVFFILGLFAISCSGYKSAQVSPTSSNAGDIPLERLGDDWGDDDNSVVGDDRDGSVFEEDPSLVG